MRRRRDILERDRPRLEIVPMIDIMMFLLVFFVMIVIRMIPDSGVTLSLPSAATAEQLPHTNVVVMIDAQGLLHVQDQVMTTGQLQAYLQSLSGEQHADVIVAGDNHTPLQEIMDVMDAARKAGITDIGIATKAP
jgi:biopolymer transport protein ExbD